MYSFLSNCFFLLLVSGTANYIFPELFYNILLFINFYYRKSTKYVKNLLKGDLKICEIKNINNIHLTLIYFKYKDEKFMKLVPIKNNKPYTELINVDVNKFNKVRKRIECPNNKNSFIMASIETDKDDIDILVDIQQLSGLYLEDIHPVNVTKYFRYKYSDIEKYGTLNKWGYMRNDGEEYSYIF